ncbi:hypothetical protein N0V85_005079 [Neurospora sp. IMI 360204]|nr:hypothetical protein N0V85_005079 [Neurospora sp. IMI 360204]
MEANTTEPIAVIGFDLKFPGDANTPEKFYDFLLSGRSALSEVPKDRYNLDAFYHPDAQRSGTTNVRHAHFLKDDIAAFDAPFFTITQAEAICMDPQQRGLLETVYRALENGSKTSVHVGCFTREYDSVVSRDPEIELKYLATGTGTSMLANRLSWFYDFRGPSLTLDTACSSSLVAVHQGCTSLRLGEASMAVVAGCNLFYNPDTVIPLTSLGFLSPDGKCYSFDHRANGYSRGEGFGVAVLKRLSDALRDGDTIRAVIRNTCTNQDGRSPGITQPTREAQANLIKQSYEALGLDRGLTRYFEAHGTGTPVGDPIEASAISDAFSEFRTPEDPLYVGAVKSNIGHLEGAAGIAGLLKTVMVLERGIIPPNMWFEKKNPKIPDEWNFQFPTSSTVWPTEGIRRASVNSFGYGGSNATVIVDDALHFLAFNGLKGRHRTVLHPKLPPFAITDGTNEHVSNALDGEDATDHDMNASAQGSHVSNLLNGDLNGEKAPTAINGHANGHTNGTTNGARDGVTNGVKNGFDNGTNGQHAEPTSTHNGHAKHADGLDRHPGKDRLFILSAFDEGGIQRLATAYREHLLNKVSSFSTSIKSASSEGSESESESSYLSDLSYTLAFKRTHFSWSSWAVADSVTSLARSLETTQLNKATRAPDTGSSKPQLALVFTGQGAQWAGMGRELLAVYEPYRASLSAADEYLRKALGCSWSITEVLQQQQDTASFNINDPAFSQPVCTALQVALVDLLASWGVFPQAVVGHSSGEIAAAYAAGAISRESAWKLAYYRGILSSELARVSGGGGGGMISVALDKATAESYISRVDAAFPHGGAAGSLAVACINSPKNVTVSGAVSKIDYLKQELLDKDNIFARKLAVGNAYHSAYMQPIADLYLQLIGSGLVSGGQCRGGGGPEEQEQQKKQSPVPRFYSSLTGAEAKLSELCEPAYWVQNLISPVRFSEALSRLVSDSSVKAKKRKLGASGPQQKKTEPITELLEIGPHGALRGPIREILEQIPGADKVVAYQSLLMRNSSSTNAALNAAGWLFSRGYKLDMSAVNPPSNGRPSPSLLVDLPSYPFDHSKSYWRESRISKGYRFRKVVRHELLGAPVPDWNKNNALWRNWIRLGENPWIRDHRITGSTLYPAAGMLVMAIEASRQMANPDKGPIKAFRFREVSLHMALRVPASAEGVETHFYLRPYMDSMSSTASNWSEFQLFSHENDEWREHCRGLVQTEYEAAYTPVDNGLEDRAFRDQCAEYVASAEKRCGKPVSTNQLYELLQTVGFDFGSTFQTLSDVRIDPDGDRNMIATITSKVPEIKSKMPQGFVQEHLVHPTTLDGVLQAVIVALTRGGREVREAMVPTSMKELWISADALASHDQYRLAAHADFLGLRQAEASIIAVDPETHAPLIKADGFISTAVSGRSATDDGEDEVRQHAFNIDWKPEPSLLDQKSAAGLFRPPQDLVDFDPSQLIADVEGICYMYLRRYAAANPDLWTEHIGGKPHLQKYVAWMKHVFDRFDRGDLVHAKGQQDWNKMALDDESFSKMEAEMAGENGTPEAKLVVAVGKALPSILSGEVDPLQVLFNDKLSENVYRYGTGAEIIYAQLSGFVDAMAHKNPSMKILEIGAGTGGATVTVINTLTHHGENEFGARFERYDYTDISPSFFEQAKETFESAADRMQFKVLNIENDPRHQGFEEGEYDLVIAANVIHATKNIEATLKNVRQLLKPGGKFALYELTNINLLRAHFGFGLLPGWWLSDEPYRAWGPLMTVPDWSVHLQRAAFTGVDLAFDDFSGSENQINTIMISTATTPAAAGQSLSTTSPPPPTIIVADQSSEFQNEVAKKVEASLKGKGNNTHCEVEVVSVEDLLSANLDKKICIFLPEIEASFLENMTADRLSVIKKMTTSLSGILWLTNGGGKAAKRPEIEMITGLSRAIRAENPAINFVTLTFEDDVDVVEGVEAVCQHTLSLFTEIFVKGGKDVIDNSFSVSNGVTHIGRVIEADYMNRHISQKTTKQVAAPAKFGEDPSRALDLVVGTPGLLDSLQFDDDQLYDTPLQEGDVEFKVAACGLNFLDIMVSLGQVIGTALGVEGSGIVTRTGPNSRFKVGDRVCGIARGTMRTYARARETSLVTIPEDLDWTTAASLPVVYVTAYAALYDIAHLKKGDTVLVHAAAGGVGQACIQLAQHRGAEVYATVGSLEKRDLLRARYGIPEDHILSSRDLSFKHGIMRLTKGRGVDVVVNALSGDALRATWDCVAPFGRFVEVGKVDIYSSARLNMDKFKYNVTFGFVDVGYMANNDGLHFNAILEDCMRLVRDGAIQQLHPVQVYPFGQIQDAFRYMQSGAHSGKIVLEPNEDDMVPVVPSRKPKYNFDPSASYVISGGLGGLGRSIARWMASRGARHLVLLSRFGPVRESGKALVAELQSAGVHVETPACDVSDAQSLKKTLDGCLTKMPPIRGCIQGSMVLKDTMFENMSIDDWHTAIKPKVDASWNLHEALLDKKLDFFILLSSTSGIVGNRGQSNYCAGNTYQDALARYRVSQGLPATSLDLGMILSVGFVAENAELIGHLRAEGFTAMREEEFHALLDGLCGPGSSVPSSLLKSQICLGLELPEALAQRGIEAPGWQHDPLFSHLFQMRRMAGGLASADKTVNYGLLLGATDSLDTAEAIVLEAMLTKISKALGVETVNLDASKPLHAFGVDSLVAVELRTWLLKEVGAEVAVFDIMGGSSIRQLATLVASRSSFVHLKEVDE